MNKGESSGGSEVGGCEDTAIMVGGGRELVIGRGGGEGMKDLFTPEY